MRKCFVFLFILLSIGVKAQTAQEVLEYKRCFEKAKSHGLQEKRIDIDGEVYDLMCERDFARENIMLSDKEELQKLSDVISYQKFGVKGRFGNIYDWKSMRELFGEGFRGEKKFEQALMSYSQDGTFQLMCHGVSDQSHNSLDKVRLDGKIVEADRVAKIILKEMDGYEIITKYSSRPIVVVIHACGAGGTSDNSFASKLSGYLAEKSPNIYVVAAPGAVHPVASWPYTEVVMDKNGSMTKWNCFHNGKFISAGDKDFARTVTMIQNRQIR